MGTEPMAMGGVRARAALALFALVGCASVPAGTITLDRMEYSQVLSASWKRQTLLNGGEAT